jgi:two-component system, LytTR family, sensor kinase
VGELLNVVGLGTGVVLYTMLLVMVVRAPHRTDTGSEDRLPLATAILGLTWNLCALPLYTVSVPAVSPLLPYVAFAGFSALGFLPAVVVHSALRLGDAGAHRFLRRLLTVLAYVTSAIAVAIHAFALVTGRPVPAVPAMQLLTYAFVAMVLPVAIITRHQPGGRRALSVAALAAFTVSALHLTQLHTGHDSWLAELAGHHASLLLALAILYQEYRFAFADLFLKRALVILALVVTAFAALAVFDPLASSSPDAAKGTARDIGLLVTLWVITALAYPWLHSTTSWFVDRVVLQRPDYGALRRTITAQLREHDDVDLLLDDVCRLITPAFGGVAARWHELASSQPAESAGLVLSTDGRARIVVPTADAPQYLLESSRLTDGRRLLSDDVAALEIIGVAVARRIDAIRLTRERWDRELREQEMSKLATEAELRALRAQINPHFLFNALTTIGYLIQTAPPRALETMMRLTALLRGVLKSEGELTTLGHEVDLIEAYLDVERARFEDRLEVHIWVPEALRAARVPPLLLQPIVENAIKHGVTPRREGGRIVLTAAVDEKQRDQLCLSVRDTGAGATEAAIERGRERGLGLRNVERRLAVQYGGDASLNVYASPGLGMLVEIRLPVSIWADTAGAGR